MRRDVIACGWLVLDVAIERKLGRDAPVDGGNRAVGSQPLLGSSIRLKPRWLRRTIERTPECWA